RPKPTRIAIPEIRLGRGSNDDLRPEDAQLPRAEHRLGVRECRQQRGSHPLVVWLRGGGRYRIWGSAPRGGVALPDAATRLVGFSGTAGRRFTVWLTGSTVMPTDSSVVSPSSGSTSSVPKITRPAVTWSRKRSCASPNSYSTT